MHLGFSVKRKQTAVMFARGGVPVEIACEESLSMYMYVQIN